MIALIGREGHLKNEFDMITYIFGSKKPSGLAVCGLVDSLPMPSEPSTRRASDPAGWGASQASEARAWRARVAGSLGSCPALILTLWSFKCTILEMILGDEKRRFFD